MSGFLTVGETGSVATNEAGLPSLATVGALPPNDVVTPPVPAWSQADYARAFQTLLPKGLVWPRSPGAIQSAVCAALVPTYVRSAEAAAALLADIFPPTTAELLPTWEETLGLPDPCAGPAPTTQARVAQVVARFISGGGQSVPYFISLLASLGFTASVTEYTPARCGMALNAPLYNDDWAFAWTVEIGPPTTAPALVAACELRRMQPAHTNAVVTSNGVPVYPPSGQMLLPGLFRLGDGAGSGSSLDGLDFMQ